MAGLPYCSLMMNLFLSLIDRYVSVAYSSWYRRKVTITWIVSGQIGFFSIIGVLMKGPYLLEIFPFPPQITTMELKLFRVTGFLTLLLCVFGQICVYSKVKCFLRLEKDLDVSPSTDGGAYNGQGHQTTEFMGEELPRESEQEKKRDDFPRHQTATASRQKATAIFPSPFFIRIGDQIISRLELEAARHAVDSVTLFLVFFLPAFVALMFAISAGCLIPATHLIRHECSEYQWTLAYARGLVVFYPIVSPIFFIRRSHDLLKALNRRQTAEL